MMKNKLWEEFTVEVYNPHIGHKIPICGLCGNSGVIDTTTTARCFDKYVGIKSFCICPNGRKLKTH